MSLLSHNLKAFVAVAEKKTVLAASKEIGLTQTGVTQRIRALERELDTTLFTRSRTGMKLTVEGEALIQYCQGAKELEGLTLSRIKNDNPEYDIQLTVAGPTSAVTSRIIESCLPIYKKWPNLYLHFQIDDHSDKVGLVRSGEVQIALVRPDQVPKEMDSKMLKSDKYILVAQAAWKGRKLEDIIRNERIIDFYENDLTTLNYLKMHDLVQFVGRPRLFVNNNSALIQLLIGGVGFGTLTQEIAAPYLASGELISLNRSQTFEDPGALIWYPRHHMSLYFKEIIRSIK
jgi:LysR family transcriptional regulator, chromosome initiation inhibitor